MKYATQACNANKSTIRLVKVAEAPGTSCLSVEDAVPQIAEHSIRIFTLGRFNISIDGQPFRWEGKAQHRPLALLKALIALGGRDIAACRLGECLWPDAEDGPGPGNLAITLHRLRALLETKAAVLSDNGRLSLCPQVCWVDAWQFERLVNEGLRNLDKCAAGAEGQLQAALDMYAGPFLAREADDSWIFAPRIRLKSKFERLVIALVGRYESDERHAKAIEVCLQAVERDPFNELLYRRLIVCYLKSGELALAARTYLQCREALSKGLAIAPSPETERLYFENIRGQHGHAIQPAGAPPLQSIGVRTMN